jgi:cytochrome c peroxidase
MRATGARSVVVVAALAFLTTTWIAPVAVGRAKGAGGGGDDRGSLDATLARVLAQAGFSGRIESTLPARLGRPLDPRLADLGRLLWFDTLHSLHHDNTCAGCHSPTNGFGDSQSIAIGVQSNMRVGPDRRGPRNQRRSPMVINTAFLSALMWNGRFSALSGNPFDNSLGFHFPPPEGDTLAPPRSPRFEHLLQAQAHIPPTEMVEVAGFTGVCRPRDLGPHSVFCQFDDGLGETVPLPDRSGFRNDRIRRTALALLNQTPEYRRLFAGAFPEAGAGAPIDFVMFGRAIAEFEFTLTFANAPIDRFARGDRAAMTAAQKRGALLFFGRAGCVACHAVSGGAAEMFTDAANHVVGVPQIAPAFGAGAGNMIFDGPQADEDFGLEQVTGDPADRYKFRTAPLRNLAVAPAFFHNGAFTRLEDAIRHHLDPYASARRYDPIDAGVVADLAGRVGPIEPVLSRLDRRLRHRIELDAGEQADLLAFVRDALLDDRAGRSQLCALVPRAVPSGSPVLQFQGCSSTDAGRAAIR